MRTLRPAPSVPTGVSRCTVRHEHVTFPGSALIRPGQDRIDRAVAGLTRAAERCFTIGLRGPARWLGAFLGLS
ncbi:hypothetical protein AMIS_40220 [Actinoplanes missouriensis 431]|uniref:Transposase n=1 Tax=Actinoplanes missouriensis (strain ATCC 14538 / DSM 43046 / CBS 188.64 / JCM 3121 / NBRC 102363 / NCIMB 12654 / NRRL B-3342 / UNCC 431) TaxID=512565 RepID=I0H8A5_ACTM4|nr:hypothetical protein AMIS_40220 [Actinoplanes missouriensis 431]